MPFNLPKFLRSFRYAVRGLTRLVRTEQNAGIHAVAALTVAIAALAAHLSPVELAVLFFAIVLVFAVEITNTAIEKLLDLVHPEQHEQIAYIKDALAGAVLIASVIAVVVACLVFYPHLAQYL